MTNPGGIMSDVTIPQAGLFATKYRIARDSFHSRLWAVQAKRWWWPFWLEVGNGMLASKAEALDLINELRTLR